MDFSKIAGAFQLSPSDVASKSTPSDRNKGPILAELRKHLPPPSVPKPRVLEVASGYGHHVIHFATALPAVTFEPTEVNAESLPIIEEVCEGLENVAAPRSLDVGKPDEWAVEPDTYDGVIAANLCHISPWSCTLGLVRGSARVLKVGGFLQIYGPFKQGGEFSTDSNAQFDASLRGRDESWGIRDVEAITAEAEPVGLALETITDMPANNLILLLRKTAGDGR